MRGTVEYSRGREKRRERRVDLDVNYRSLPVQTFRGKRKGAVAEGERERDGERADTAKKVRGRRRSCGRKEDTDNPCSSERAKPDWTALSSSPS